MEYTTERGITLDIVPIPLLLDKIRQAHPDVPPVTYTEYLAGGASQEIEITAQDARMWAERDPVGWAPYAEKWAAYEAAVKARAEKVNDAIWKAILRYAIRVDLPASDEWAEFQAEELGVNVPAKGTHARREHYIWTECIGGTRDVLRITALAGGADLTEEALQAAEDSFRDTLQAQATVNLRGRAQG